MSYNITKIRGIESKDYKEPLIVTGFSGPGSPGVQSQCIQLAIGNQAVGLTREDVYKLSTILDNFLVGHNVEASDDENQ
jgi:hypothetical protein